MIISQTAAEEAEEAEEAGRYDCSNCKVKSEG